jgi:hypothetical protein
VSVARQRPLPVPGHWVRHRLARGRRLSVPMARRAALAAGPDRSSAMTPPD